MRQPTPPQRPAPSNGPKTSHSNTGPRDIANLTSPQARTLGSQVLACLDELTNLLSEETALVRKANLAEAVRLEAPKAAAAQKVVAMMDQLALYAPQMRELAPDQLSTIITKNAELSKIMSLNLTVLATAKSVSEGLIQEVAEVLQRRERPQTYGARGQATSAYNRPATPLAVSKML